MLTPLASPQTKITARHQAQRAYVYIRQSTLKQVQQNRESQQNQYALTERALALGWIPERIHVIDADLGHSGQDRSRAGFQELVAEVSLGHVGMILAYEASRLARSNAAWYELLDLASLVGTLIADTEGVYDPRNYNDRLLLGLRGMLSEAELHLLRLRLDAGRLRQVERGVFRQHLPTGLTRLPDGRVVKDPDQQVQHTLEEVFLRFAALGSAQQVLRSLHADQILLPRRQTAGVQAGELVWRLPTASALRDMLHNPAYAGAFAYGRKSPPREPHPGQVRQVCRPMEEWTALRREVYPAYISWEEFMANQERLADNTYRFAQRAKGAPRQGRGLLTGLVVCGRCGHQMRVAYKPALRYFCAAKRNSHATPACLHLDGASIEAAVTEAFFSAIQPAELDLLEAALLAQQAEQARLAQHHTEQVTKLEYEARLAERQYRAVDPDNRLVAAELEHRWELALRALATVREAAARFAELPSAPALDPKLREQLSTLGRSLPTLWASGRLQRAQQKELLRSLIRRIVLTRPQPERIEVKILWVSGVSSRLTVHPTVGRSRDLSNHAQLVERVVTLSAAGYQDREIAHQLTAEGFHSAHHAPLPLSLVRAVRTAQGQASLTQQYRGQRQVEGRWTVRGLAELLDVNRHWLYDQIQTGKLPAQKQELTGRYFIEDDPTLLQQLRERVPTKHLH